MLLSALDERRNTTIGNVVFNFDKVVFLLATTGSGQAFGGVSEPPDKTVLRSLHDRRDGRDRMAPLRGEARAGRSRSRDLHRDFGANAVQSATERQHPRAVGGRASTVRRSKTCGAFPTREEVAGMMNVTAVARWFEDTQGIDRNGLTSEHAEYLKLLRTRGASAEEEIRRALGISNRADFVIVSEYLTRLNLIRVGPGGRSLTPEGRRYLRALAA